MPTIRLPRPCRLFLTHTWKWAWPLCAAVFFGCADLPGDLPPVPDSTTGSFLAIATAEKGSGALHTVDLTTLAVRKDIDKTLDAQAIVRAYGQKLYVLDQTHGAVRVYDLAQDFANPGDYPIGKTPEVPAAQANPHDIYIDAPRKVAYVTLYGSYGATAVTGAVALAVLDLNNLSAGISRFVPLPVAAADPDNNPEASHLAGCTANAGDTSGDKLLVLLENLNRNSNYDPAGSGRLAIVNLEDPSDVSVIDLAGENPIALHILPGCKEAIVGSAGRQLSGTLLGTSGIERVDLLNKRSLGLILSDKDLRGNVSALDAIDAHGVFVAISTRNGEVYDNNLYVADAIAGTLSQKLLGPLSFIPQVRVAASRLFVLGGARPKSGSGQLEAGLYVGKATGEPIPTGPKDLGLPPQSCDLYTR